MNPSNPSNLPESENNVAPIKKIGLKKKNIQQADSALDIQQAFSDKADHKFEEIEAFKADMWDLSIKFKSLLENKVLPENKSPIAINFEKEVLDKLVQLASRMNADDTQEDGIGSTALCMLLMKCMLVQRDIINKLSYQIDQFIKNKNVE